MIATISNSTQTLIKEIQLKHDKQEEIDRYSNFTDSLVKDFKEIVETGQKQYKLIDEEYYNQLKLLTEEKDHYWIDFLEKKVKDLNERRTVIYEKIINNQCKINMIHHMYNEYLKNNDITN